MDPEETMDADKTQARLVRELAQARRRIAQLEAAAAERRPAERALRESEARYRAIVEAFDGLVYICSADYRVEFMNQRLVERTGYDATGELCYRALHDRDSICPWCVNEQVCRGETVRWEVQSPKDDRWYYVVNTPIHRTDGTISKQALILDITEHKVAEEALIHSLEERLATEETLRQRNRELDLLNRASQAFSASLDLDQVLLTVLEETRRLMEVVACSVWLLDPETGELVCRQVVGPQSDVVRGWRLSPGEGIAGWVAHHGESLVVPDILEDERHFAGVDRQTGLMLRSILSVPLRVKQRVIGVLQAVAAEVNRFAEADRLLLESLAASAAVAIENAKLYDQVQRYAAELEARVVERTCELEEANAQLQELDQLKSKFVADVSHELRTPVANITLYLHLLERGSADRGDRYLTVLKEQAEQLADLVEDILNLSRLDLAREQVKFSPVDLNAVIEQVVVAYRPQAEAAGLELTFTGAEDLPPAWGERDQLSQVVTNLVVNAVNYTSAGQVCVTTHLDTGQGQICLEVQDTGMGIDPEDLPHIFKSFYRGQGVGSSNIPGTGLGLAIVREIVDLHEGSIKVESQVGQGSTFRVWLPVAQQE